MNLKHLIVIGLVCIVHTPASARTLQEMRTVDNTSSQQAKELVLHFRFDRSLVDSAYRDNHATLMALHELFTDTLIAARIDSIRVSAYSSPEGNADYNLRLAIRRARAVKGYIVWKYPNINQYSIRISAQVESWRALGDIIRDDANVPCKEEVLQILALDKSDERIEALLKKLNAGIPYKYISNKILPDLRNASICTVYMRPMKHPDVQEQPAQVLTSSSNSPLSFSAERKILSPMRTQGVDSSTPLRMTGGSTRKPVLAVKTNLLFDAALMPNIEVEVPIGRRWSINGEYMFPWWRMEGDKYCMQVLMGGLEGRYWLGNRKNGEKREVLTGHFLGFYAGGGKYDLQWKENGYQGEFFIAAGLSYGYAHPIARNLRLEYNIGVGLLRTDYRHYHARDDYQTLLWQENGNYTWIGPTKLKISLVWLLTKRKRE